MKTKTFYQLTDEEIKNVIAYFKEANYDSDPLVIDKYNQPPIALAYIYYFNDSGEVYDVKLKTEQRAMLPDEKPTYSEYIVDERDLKRLNKFIIESPLY